MELGKLKKKKRDSQTVHNILMVCLVVLEEE